MQVDFLKNLTNVTTHMVLKKQSVMQRYIFTHILSEGFGRSWRSQRFGWYGRSGRFVRSGKPPEKSGRSMVGVAMNYCLWTVMSEQNSQSCLKLGNSQNPFSHILEKLNKNFEKKNGMICSFSSDSQCLKVYSSHSSKNASSQPPLGKIS